MSGGKTSNKKSVAAYSMSSKGEKMSSPREKDRRMVGEESFLAVDHSQKDIVNLKTPKMNKESNNPQGKVEKKPRSAKSS
jgi:hypothetical protein